MVGGERCSLYKDKLRAGTPCRSGISLFIRTGGQVSEQGALTFESTEQSTDICNKGCTNSVHPSSLGNAVLYTFSQPASRLSLNGSSCGRRSIKTSQQEPSCFLITTAPTALPRRGVQVNHCRRNAIFLHVHVHVHLHRTIPYALVKKTRPLSEAA